VAEGYANGERESRLD